MEVGEPCFAHVRSHPWWPAKIVEKYVSKKKETYRVVFYGTMETASLPLKELTAISPGQVDKFSSSAALKRKWFKEGVNQMVQEFQWIQTNYTSPSLPSSLSISAKLVNPVSVPR